MDYVLNLHGSMIVNGCRYSVTGDIVTLVDLQICVQETSFGVIVAHTMLHTILLTISFANRYYEHW